MGKVSNCGKNENGAYHQGQAGDQTGEEWRIINWYDSNWNVVLRHPDKTVRKYIANLAIESALNENIGYDQDDRYTFWQELEKVSFVPRAIRTKCEADCSSSVCSIIRAVGYLLDIEDFKKIDLYSTYTMKDPLVNGFTKDGTKYNPGFIAKTSRTFTKTESNLKKGDILLNESHHTCIYVGDAQEEDIKVKVNSTPFEATFSKPINATLASILVVQNNNDDENEECLEVVNLNGYRSTVFLYNEKDKMFKEYEPYIFDGQNWNKYLITMCDKDKKEDKDRFRYIYNKIE